MHLTIALSAAILLLVSTASAATIDDVIASNSALTSQADTVDIPVVAVTPETPATTVQQLPPALQSLTAAMSSALSANNPTPPTSDPATEDIVSHSYGLFANTLEELFADYVQQRNNLIGVFNIKADLYNQLVPFNTAYKDYATFMLSVVGEQKWKTAIGYNTQNATYTLDMALDTYKP